MNNRRVVGLAVGTAATVVLAAVIGWAGGVGPLARDETSTETLKVMTFNVFYGGDDYDLTTGKFCKVTNGCPETLERVVATIRASGADVVGLEEGEGNTNVVADKLGWYAHPRTQTISRYPILDPPAADGAYVLIQLKPDKVVAFSSVHLPSDPYGPYAVRDGASPAKLRALEQSTRLPMLTARLTALRGLLADERMPVFLVGDFNSPSNLDWTEAVAAKRKEVRYPFAWPVGETVAAAGFRDSYREAYPDPVAVPGFTWTPGGPEKDKREVHDRIDWVLVAGPATTAASAIVGEDAGPDVDIETGTPFASDHRAVVSIFEVEAADTPTLVSLDDRNVTVGQPVRAIVHARKNGQLRIVPSGKAADAQNAVATIDVEPDTSTDITTDRLAPGQYAAVLVVEGAEVSRAPFWVYANDAPIVIETTETAFARDAPITFRFSNMPGNRWDWIGLFKATETPLPTDGTIAADAYDYLYYEYTKTEIEGTGAFTRASQVGAGSWPLPPGRYELRLLLDDGYVAVAKSPPFTVR
jgi:endonuclease/exonuclease/phosphatase family metal-dependent hydrolase